MKYASVLLALFFASANAFADKYIDTSDYDGSSSSDMSFFGVILIGLIIYILYSSEKNRSEIASLFWQKQELLEKNSKIQQELNQTRNQLVQCLAEWGEHKDSYQSLKEIVVDYLNGDTSEEEFTDAFNKISETYDN